MQAEVSCVDDSLLDGWESLSRLSHEAVQSFQQVTLSALIDYQQVLMYCKNKQTSEGGEGQNVDWA
jgi:hypothetical protein